MYALQVLMSKLLYQSNMLYRLTFKTCLLDYDGLELLLKPLQTTSKFLVEFNQYLVFVDVSLILSVPLRTAVHSHKLMEKVINKKWLGLDYDCFEIILKVVCLHMFSNRLCDALWKTTSRTASSSFLSFKSLVFFQVVVFTIIFYSFLLFLPTDIITNEAF